MMRWLVALSFLLIASSTLAEEPFRVRVLTYNIHHGEGIDGRLDLERIARIIKSVEPDLVALQEIDFVTERTGRVDQAAELSRLTGMKMVPGDNIDYRGGRYGNAALSRWPITRHKNHALPLMGPEQRGVLDVEINPGEGRPTLRFLVTHLDHRRDDAERLASAAVINDMVADHDTPAILAGDLNAVPDSEVLKRFKAQWSNATADKPLPTIPVREPRRQIDYVLYRPADSWRVVEAKVLDKEPEASDHLPLFVVLEWRDKRGE
jgi:endonuclease/exonuclease/phosphatase family metal-dependent hydrolase